MSEKDFELLQTFLSNVPAIKEKIGHGINEEGFWWVEFRIDIQHPLAWQVVQEIGHVVNYLSLDERLPTTFYPVSPPPYMNGGPEDFLSWVIESTNKEFKPVTLRDWLEGRLPQPVADKSAWLVDDDEE